MLDRPRHPRPSSGPRRRSKIPGRILTLAALTLAMLACSTLPWPPGAQASLLQEKRAELQAVERAIAQNESDIAAATAEIERLQAEVADLDAAIQEARLHELETRVELAKKREELGDRLVRYYKDNRASIPPVVQLVLDSPDLQDLVNVGPHLVRVAQEGSRLVEEVNALVRGLALQQQELARTQSELSRAQEAEEQARIELVGLLEQAESQRETLSAEVAVLEAADALVQKAAAHRARWRGRVSGSTWALAQGFTFPVAGRYAFSNDWGNPRPDDRTHKGTDIMAPYGTPLVACVNGYIQEIDHDQRLGGVIIWLRGDNGHRYYYAHLARVKPGLRTGQRILAGFEIGEVGTSGNAQGGAPHLHFQIHPGGGGPINPYPVLRISG